ncbi:hypothetical protein BY996DRAFT_6531208 [Phakopsora pachyrhizi]|nr:hypothetical protein BY996DRAFT_6531208 [Phakopsora pachyrhizi]
MTVLIDGKLEDPLIKDKKVSLLGGVICGQKISMGSVSEGSKAGNGWRWLVGVGDGVVRLAGSLWAGASVRALAVPHAANNGGSRGHVQFASELHVIGHWVEQARRRWEPGSQVTGPGRVIPGRGRNVTPGEILIMQGVLDWMRAGLFEDRGHKEDGYGWSRGMEWKGGRWQWCKEKAGGGCGGRIGKRGQGKGGAESAPGEEGVAVEKIGWRHWKEGQTLGGGAHQGQSGWSKTTGAMDL